MHLQEVKYQNLCIITSNCTFRRQREQVLVKKHLLQRNFA